MPSNITPFLKEGLHGTPTAHYLQFPVQHWTEGLKANGYYFNHPEWAAEYLQYCHRSPSFISRWKAAMGSWDGKIVVDIGCGPGNLLASLGGKPKAIIGVDIAPGSLQLAKKVGYTTVLADAAHLPFKSHFADIVTLNATLHHSDNMSAVLSEAARLLKPGGLLLTDHDPQWSAWNYKGPAKLLWNARLWYYRYTGQGFHKSNEQQYWGLACEIHHQPGHGVTRELFMNVLQPLGFDLQVYPHNHTAGAEVLQGHTGKAALKYRLGNLLSGRNPGAPHNALALTCVAKKKATVTAMRKRKAGGTAVALAEPGRGVLVRANFIKT